MSLRGRACVIVEHGCTLHHVQHVTKLVSPTKVVELLLRREVEQAEQKEDGRKDSYQLRLGKSRLLAANATLQLQLVEALLYDTTGAFLNSMHPSVFFRDLVPLRSMWPKSRPVKKQVYVNS